MALEPGEALSSSLPLTLLGGPVSARLTLDAVTTQGSTACSIHTHHHSLPPHLDSHRLLQSFRHISPKALHEACYSKGTAVGSGGSLLGVRHSIWRPNRLGIQPHSSQDGSYRLSGLASHWECFRCACYCGGIQL